MFVVKKENKFGFYEDTNECSHSLNELIDRYIDKGYKIDMTDKDTSKLINNYDDNVIIKRLDDPNKFIDKNYELIVMLEFGYDYECGCFNAVGVIDPHNVLSMVFDDLVEVVSTKVDKRKGSCVVVTQVVESKEKLMLKEANVQFIKYN